MCLVAPNIPPYFLSFHVPLWRNGYVSIRVRSTFGFIDPLAHGGVKPLLLSGRCVVLFAPLDASLLGFDTCLSILGGIVPFLLSDVGLDVS